MDPVRIGNRITDQSGLLQQEKISRGSDWSAKSELSQREKDNLLKYNHELDFKVYNFSGRLKKDETHLGRNFDVTI
ncbi:MAG: hypothetical protein JXR48_12580 [Candidatus Delongbacteria bacterium]|nr:hypothetical protein [Candidatus Delongbacteria bacterium]MBN2835787.1 hypothetical protein [Candidatus Delongbacteria bacterium]